MRVVTRTLSILIMLLIIMITPCGLWMYNLNIIAMNPQTYKDAMRSQNFYTAFLPVVIANVVGQQDIPVFSSFREQLTAPELAIISDRLLPPEWLQVQIEDNLDRLFEWLNSSAPLPDLRLELTELKTRLSSPQIAEVVEQVTRFLRPCSAEETRAIEQFQPDAVTLEEIPLCAPESPELQQKVRETYITAFQYIGNTMPTSWNLRDEIRQQLRDQPTEDNEIQDLGELRALIWLMGRLIVLLFLIPISLFSIIVMIHIRSGKNFFRWLGWGAMISGLTALIPVVLLPIRFAPFFTDFRGNTAGGQMFAERSELLMRLFGGMINAIDSQITLSALPYIVLVILFGFVALVISVLLPKPDARVEKWQIQAEQQSSVVSTT